MIGQSRNASCFRGWTYSTWISSRCRKLPGLPNLHWQSDRKIAAASWPAAPVHDREVLMFARRDGRKPAPLPDIFLRQKFRSRDIRQSILRLAKTKMNQAQSQQMARPISPESQTTRNPAVSQNTPRRYSVDKSAIKRWRSAVGLAVLDPSVNATFHLGLCRFEAAVLPTASRRRTTIGPEDNPLPTTPATAGADAVRSTLTQDGRELLVFMGHSLWLGLKRSLSRDTIS